MKKFLKKILLGITLPQEYLCVSIDEYKHPLRIFAMSGVNKHGEDISEKQLLVGYKPLLIGIPENYLTDDYAAEHRVISLLFKTDALESIASLEVKLIKEVKLNSISIFLFEGLKGIQSFTNPIHRISNNLHYVMTSDKKKNIFLEGNLYKQVKIAYSVPRKIYLASVGTGGLFNIFPTDLSGLIGENNFIISLRSTGKVCKQVEQAGKCLVAQMDSGSYKEVYKLGKNHMRELSNVNSFEISLRDERSEKLNLPVPLKAIMYYELEKIDKSEIGIHTIHFLKVINKVKLSESNSVLAHIHRDVAEWRLRNGIDTNYLLRN